MYWIFRSACTLYTVTRPDHDVWVSDAAPSWVLTRIRALPVFLLLPKHPVLPVKTGSVAVSYSICQRERENASLDKHCSNGELRFLLKSVFIWIYSLLTSLSCIFMNKVRCCDSLDSCLVKLKCCLWIFYLSVKSH